MDITSDNAGVYDDGYDAGYAAAPTPESNDADVYNDGTPRAKPLDITTDNAGVYDDGYAAGEASVDITSDNAGVRRRVRRVRSPVDMTSDNADVCTDAGKDGDLATSNSKTFIARILTYT